MGKHTLRNINQLQEKQVHFVLIKINVAYTFFSFSKNLDVMQECLILRIVVEVVTVKFLTYLM